MQAAVYVNDSFLGKHAWLFAIAKVSCAHGALEMAVLVKMTSSQNEVARTACPSHGRQGMDFLR